MASYDALRLFCVWRGRGIHITTRGYAEIWDLDLGQSRAHSVPLNSWTLPEFLVGEPWIREGGELAKYIPGLRKAAFLIDIGVEDAFAHADPREIDYWAVTNIVWDTEEATVSACGLPRATAVALELFADWASVDDSGEDTPNPDYTAILSHLSDLWGFQARSCEVAGRTLVFGGT